MTTDRPLVIVGSGRLGKNALGFAQALGRDVKGFLDDTKPVGQRVQGLPVLGPIEGAEDTIADTPIFVAIGGNRDRERIARRLMAGGAALTSLVHPMTWIATPVPPGCYIGPFASIYGDTVLEEGLVIEAHTVIGRDNHLAAFASTGPLASVTVQCHIGPRAFLGAGSVTTNAVTVGADAVVGAGATVIRDVPPKTFVTGTPARATTRRGRHFPFAGGTG